MNALVDAARTYKGVKFRHRGRNRRGIDCAGLAWCAYRDCGVTLPDYRHYGKEPHQDGLIHYIRAALGTEIEKGPVEVCSLKPGDVIVVRFEVEPHHVAMVTNYKFGGLSVIHADGHSNKVIEHRLDMKFIRRITHVFRRPV